MTWLSAVPVVLGAAVAAATPAILRVLPAPEGEPTSPYLRLATTRFALVVGLLVALAGVAAILLEPNLWPALTGLATAGVLAAAIDARTTYLPRLLAWAGWVLTAAGLAACAATVGPEPVLRAAVGAASATALFWVFWRFGGGFGFGDVRLAPVIGASSAAVGYPTLAAALFLGGLLGVAWGLLWRAGGRGRTFPYGPALVAGPFLALLLNLQPP